jgi:hypothetical protein
VIHAGVEVGVVADRHRQQHLRLVRGDQVLVSRPAREQFRDARPDIASDLAPTRHEGIELRRE